MVLLGGAHVVRAEVLDNFNSYVSGSYIQAQNAAWSRFGAATTDGIYSIAGGAEGRGASYSVGWAAGNQGFVRYAFGAAQSFTEGASLSVDLSVSAALPDTTVVAQVTGGSGTTWAMTAAVSLTNTGYVTYNFILEGAGMTRIEGSDSLSVVMANLQSVTLQFRNVSGVGSQAIQFDNLVLSPASSIPEPSSVALALAGVAGAAAFLTRRRRGVC